MWTEVPDILHNDFHVAYQYFTRQTVANVPWTTELEQIMIKQENAWLRKKTVKLIYFDYVFSIRVSYQSLKTTNIYKI